MKKVLISESLRAFFEQEHRQDSNATLETAYQHLVDLYERGPDDPGAAGLASLLTETEELIRREQEHAPLADIM